MVRFEDLPLKPRGKSKRKRTKYEAVNGDDGDSSNDEEETMYSSDGYISVDTDGDEEELKGRDYRYRRARWFVCYGWKWWCQRYDKQIIQKIYIQNL